MYSWSNIKRVLFSVAKLLVYMYTYTLTTNKVNFSLVFMTSVYLKDATEHCCGLFHTVHVHSYQYSHGNSILLGLGTPLIVLLLCGISRYPAREPKINTHTRHGQQHCQSFTIIASGLGKSIHGVIVIVGLFYSVVMM